MPYNSVVNTISNIQDEELRQKLSLAKKSYIHGTFDRQVSSQQIWLKTEKFGVIKCRLFCAIPPDVAVGEQLYSIGVLSDTNTSALLLFVSTQERAENGTSLATISMLLNDMALIETEKKTLSHKLSELPVEIRSQVEEQLANELQYPIALSPPSLSMSQTQKLFEILAATYTPEAQRHIRALLGSGNSSRNRESNAVREYLSIRTFYKPEQITGKEMASKLDKQVFGYRHVKEIVSAAIDQASLTEGKYRLTMLLIGSKGVGKRTFSNAVANLRNKPVLSIHCNAICNEVDVSGCSTVFDGAGSGVLGKQLQAAGTTDCTLVLSNIDAMEHDDPKNGDPDNALIPLISTGEYTNVYWGTPLDVHHTWVIATAENPAEISASLLSSFDHVVYLDELTLEDRINIARNHILPELCGTFGVQAADTISFFPDELVRYVLSELCFDDGLDQFKTHAKALIFAAIQRKMDLQHETFTQDEVNEILHKDEILSGDEAILYHNRVSYSAPDWKAIRKKIAEANHDVDPKRREYARLAVKTLADLHRNTISTPVFRLQSFRKRVDQTHSGMQKEKLCFARKLNQLAETGNPGKPILLVGPPGTGKTTLCKSVADSIPFVKISLNSANSTYLKGLAATYANAAPGAIASALANSGKTAIVLLDEIDKLGSGQTEQGRREAESALADLLDQDRRCFRDLFLDVSLDLHSVLFVATANSCNDLPAWLLDRFEVISVAAYMSDQKRVILNEHIMPKVLSASNMQPGSIKLTREAEDLLVTAYSSTAGARQMEQYVEVLVSSAFLLNGRKPTVLSKDDLAQFLGPAPAIKRVAAEQPPGSVHGLSVDSFGLGHVLDIQVAIASKDKVTGLAEGSALDSCEVARAALSNLFPEIADEHFHVHWTDGGTRKDGPSAGVSVAMAMYSAHTGNPIPGDYSMTGEIDIYSRVHSVGGASAKIQGAIDAGCKYVFIPRENAEALRPEELERFRKAINIIPIDSLSQIIDAVSMKQTV